MTNSDVVSLLMNSQYYKQGYKQGVSDTLDKIRAEIEELDVKYAIGYGENNSKFVRLWNVLQIIDKCKAQSEEES